ncbi:MAG: hypothetical protein R2850_11020 [Bacteroidia bacterium]
MCGIAGIFGVQGLSADTLTRISQSMKHRGPDGDGFLLLSDSDTIACYSADTAEECIGNTLPFSPAKKLEDADFSQVRGAFIHRRLAIIDTHEGGHQPMMHGNAWITYNGEIYNYKELREELEKKGYQFLTQSDTEVVLAAWREWNEECHQHFNGMWAFAIADMDSRKLFWRDRFEGIKAFVLLQFRRGSGICQRVQEPFRLRRDCPEGKT